MSPRDRRRIFLLSSIFFVAACSDTSTTPHTAAGGAGQTAAAGSVSGGAGSSASGSPAGGSASGQLGGGAGGSGGASGATTAGTAGTMAGSAGAAGGVGGSVGIGCKAATVCYDFEECATPAGWTVPKFNTGEGNIGAGATLVDNVKAHSGTCSLHMKDFSGDQPQHAFLADLPANFGPVLWGRAWVFTTSAPTNHGALIKTRYAIPNSADQDWYEVGYEQKNYNGQWHNPLPPSGLPEWILRSTTPITINAWQCVEWLFDAQNGNLPEAADPRIWVDGKEIVFGPGIEYDLSNTPGLPRPVTPKANNFVSIEVGLTMYHQIDENTNIYLDELAFAKERIGCGP
jgi:hypothetical protein